MTFYKSVSFSLIISCILFLSSCEQDSIIDSYQEIEKYEWSYDYKPSFKFNITDTTSKYNLYINLRHTGEYPYKNMWMFIYTKDPLRETQQTRVNLPLADKSGAWHAQGSGDVWDHQILIQENARFPQIGEYEITLEQNMRLNPLPHVIAAGLRIETVKDNTVSD